MTQIPPAPASTEFDAEIEVEVCRLDDLPVGIGRAFDIAGRTIALFRTRSGAVHALDNRCPHKGAPLADGMLAGNCVVCPFHSFKYDLSHGACDQPGAPAVQAYPVRVESEWVFLKLRPCLPR